MKLKKKFVIRLDQKKVNFVNKNELKNLKKDLIEIIY